MNNITCKKFEHNLKKSFYILSQCLLIFFMALPFAHAQELVDDDIILPRRVELKNDYDEIIIAKRIPLQTTLSQDEIVPSVAMQTLIAFREDVDIVINLDTSLRYNGQSDIGKAERRDYLGRKPNECVVSFNDASAIFNNPNNIFVKMNFDENMIKEFIFLHEFAHCHDGDISPKNIDSVEWREALADGYAMATLLDNNLISSSNINLFKKERHKLNAIGSTLILNNIVEFYLSDIKSLHLTPIQRLNKIKLLRQSVFTEK